MKQETRSLPFLVLTVDERCEIFTERIEKPRKFDCSYLLLIITPKTFRFVKTLWNLAFLLTMIVKIVFTHSIILKIDCCTFKIFVKSLNLALKMWEFM